METSKLIKLHNALNIVIVGCVIIGIIAFLVIYGCVGSFDYAAETHTMLSADKEAYINNIFTIGIVIIAACAGVAYGSYRLQGSISNEIRKRDDRRRKTVEMRRQIDIVRKQNANRLELRRMYN